VREDSSRQAAPGQTWAHPPDGTYLPRIALVNWTRIQDPTLTVLPEGVTLEGYCGEPLGPEPSAGYECVAEAVGWRWRFRGFVEMPTVTALDGDTRRIPVVVRSIGPVTSEAAPSGRALQA
jgi:hypothetical protein